MIANSLDYITIKGFKSIAAIEKLQLRPINILIGANGSGKSNFLGVFALLRAIREGRLEAYVTSGGGAENFLHYGSKRTHTICLQFLLASQLDYEWELSPTSGDNLFLSREKGTLRETASLVKGQASEIAQGKKMDSDSPVIQFGSRLDSFRAYHVHDTSSSSPMRKTARVDDNRALRTDGANLAAFLYLLQEKHPDSFHQIQRTIKLVAPFFEGFRLQPLNLNPDDIKLEWRHVRSDAYFDASQLSDGTLRFIALATLYLQPKIFRPSLILVDEPELGLHPYAIEILASMIRQASTDTQVIVSTQSSLLLDHFPPEDVLVADRVDGGTSVTRLDSERLAKWLEAYSLGQLWEKNEIGGRPNRE